MWYQHTKCTNSKHELANTKLVAEKVAAVAQQDVAVAVVVLIAAAAVVAVRIIRSDNKRSIYSRIVAVLLHQTNYENKPTTFVVNSAYRRHKYASAAVPYLSHVSSTADGGRRLCLLFLLHVHQVHLRRRGHTITNTITQNGAKTAHGTLH